MKIETKGLIQGYEFIAGDNVEILEELDGQRRYHSIIIEPPHYLSAERYGKSDSLDGYCDKLALLMHGCLRVLRDDGDVWIIVRDTLVNGKNLALVPQRLAIEFDSIGCAIVEYEQYFTQTVIRIRPTKGNKATINRSVGVNPVSWALLCSTDRGGVCRECGTPRPTRKLKNCSLRTFGNKCKRKRCGCEEWIPASVLMPFAREDSVKQAIHYGVNCTIISPKREDLAKVQSWMRGEQKGLLCV